MGVERRSADDVENDEAAGHDGHHHRGEHAGKFHNDPPIAETQVRVKEMEGIL